jgi:hypothetical protein
MANHGGRRAGAGRKRGSIWDHGFRIWRVHSAVAHELAERLWRLAANKADTPHADIRASRDIASRPLQQRQQRAEISKARHEDAYTRAGALLRTGTVTIDTKTIDRAVEQIWRVMEGTRRLPGDVPQIQRPLWFWLMEADRFNHPPIWIAGNNRRPPKYRRPAYIPISPYRHPAPHAGEIAQLKALLAGIVATASTKQDKVGRYTRIGIPDLAPLTTTAEVTVQHLAEMGIDASPRDVLRIWDYWQRRWKADDPRKPDKTGTS